MVRQFHDFLRSNFGWVFEIRPFYCAAWVASASAAVSAQRTEEKESQNVLRGLHKAFSWEPEGRETVTTRYINPKSIDLE